MNGIKITKEEFVERSRKIWGDQYDYTNSDFQGIKEPLTILCRKHNKEFTIGHAILHYRYSCQSPGSLPQGCPLCTKECKQSKLELMTLPQEFLEKRQAYMAEQIEKAKEKREARKLVRHRYGLPVIIQPAERKEPFVHDNTPEGRAELMDVRKTVRAEKKQEIEDLREMKRNQSDVTNISPSKKKPQEPMKMTALITALRYINTLGELYCSDAADMGYGALWMVFVMNIEGRKVQVTLEEKSDETRGLGMFQVSYNDSQMITEKCFYFEPDARTLADLIRKSNKGIA